MEKYDIIQVEDDRFMSTLVKSGSYTKNLTYRGVCSLESLKNVMEDSCADHYIIDGNFPRTDCTDSPELLAEDAVNHIRSLHPDASIIIFSKDSDEAQAIAGRLGVKYYDKTDPCAIFSDIEQ